MIVLSILIILTLILTIIFSYISSFYYILLFYMYIFLFIVISILFRLGFLRIRILIYLNFSHIFTLLFLLIKGLLELFSSLFIISLILISWFLFLFLLFSIVITLNKDNIFFQFITRYLIINNPLFLALSLFFLQLLLFPIVVINYFFKIKFYIFTLYLLFLLFVFYFSYLLLLNIVDLFLLSFIFYDIVFSILIDFSFEIYFHILFPLIFILFNIIFSIFFSFIFVIFNKFLTLSFNNLSFVNQVNFRRCLSFSPKSEIKLFGSKVIKITFLGGFKAICNNYLNLGHILSISNNKYLTTTHYLSVPNKSYIPLNIHKNEIRDFNVDLERAFMELLFNSGFLVWSKLPDKGGLDFKDFFTFYALYHKYTWLNIVKECILNGGVCYLKDLHINLDLGFWSNTIKYFKNVEVNMDNVFNIFGFDKELCEFKLGIGIRIRYVSGDGIYPISEVKYIKITHISVLTSFVELWENDFKFIIKENKFNLIRFSNLKSYKQIEVLVVELNKSNFTYAYFKAFDFWIEDLHCGF